jgi:hypothetical protein
VCLLDRLELEPCVVGDLVCEEGDEEGFEDGVGEGFVVCALFELISLLYIVYVVSGG